MFTRQTFLMSAILLFILGCSKDNFKLNEITVTDDPVLAEILDFENELDAEYALETAQSEEAGTRGFGPPIYVKAGSKNAIQEAINSAGVNGKVILKSGMHYESDLLFIDKCMTLEGESGAVLITDTKPTVDFSDHIDPAIHVYGGVNVRIRNFEIRPKYDKGNVAILMRDADFAKVEDMTIKGHQVGIAIDESNLVKVNGNHVEGPDDWATDVYGTTGIVIMNGDKARFYDNFVTQNLFGIFGSGTKGKAYDNVLHNNFIGLILCKFAPPFVIDDMTEIASKDPASKWVVKENEAHHSGWGYLIIDGANNSYVYNNQAHSNEYYDIEIAGDSYRFGEFTPTAKKTLVSAGKYQNVTIKDCGVHSQVFGGNKIDTSEDPCF